LSKENSNIKNKMKYTQPNPDTRQFLSNFISDPSMIDVSDTSLSKTNF